MILKWLGAEHLCIPLNILESCSGMKSGYVERVWSLRTLLLKFLRLVQNTEERANYSPLQRENPSCFLSNTPWVMRLSRRAGGTGTIPCPVWQGALLPGILSSGSLLGLRSIPHMHMVMEFSRSFLSVSSLPWVFHPENSRCFGLSVSKLWVLNAWNLMGSTWSSPFCIIAWNFLKTVSWDMCRAHLVCFPSFGDHSPSLPDV